MAFYSEASNLVLGDTNRVEDVFARNLTGVTWRVNRTATGGQANNGANVIPHTVSVTTNSYGHSVVAYVSTATNIVPNDTNDCDDIFLRQLVEP